MIASGDLIAARRTTALPQSMPVWAAALHDPNPIHLDAEAARRAGLGDRVINQGPINVGYVVNALAIAFPGSMLEAIEVRFLDNVFGNDVAIASGQVTSVSRADGVTRATCDMQLMVKDRLVLIATATVALNER